MLESLLVEGQIRFDVPAEDWREAVIQAGRPLLDAGKVEERYLEAMVETVQTLGPYIVLAPGVALAHARPESGVLQPGLSLIRLRSPVNFGNSDNDPVDLVFGLAALGGDEHVALMAELAEVLLRGLDEIRQAKTVSDALQIIHRLCQPPPEPDRNETKQGGGRE